MSDLNPTSTVVSKIKKLLALSTSPNEAEAASALKKAHELIVQYNLSEKDINTSNLNIIEDIFDSGSRLRHWKFRLFTAIAKYNFCDMYRTIHREIDGAHIRAVPVYSLVLVGKEVNVASSKVMIAYLTEAIDRMASKLKGESKDTIAAYRDGLTDRLIERIREMRYADLTDPSIKDLVLTEDSEVKSHMDGVNPRDTDASAKITNFLGYKAGFMDAEDISLAPQIKKETEETAKIEE